MQAELKELRDKIAWGVAGEQDYANAKSEDVRAIKGDPELKRYRFVASEDLSKGFDVEERSGTWVLSEESRDRDGDIIRVRGWELAEFRKNPIMLWAHDRKGLPIGTWPSVRKDIKRDPAPALMGQGTVYDDDVNEFAGRVAKIMAAGGLPGVSIGMIPGNEINYPESDEEREKIGLGPYGAEFRKGHTLVEASIVPVPAHQGALRQRCLKAIDAEVGSWLKSGEVTPTWVQEFRKSVTLTEDELRERAKELKRRTITVPEMPEQDDELSRLKAANEALADDKARLSRTVDHLLKRTIELEQANKTLSEAKSVGERAQQASPNGSVGASSQQASSDDERAAVVALLSDFRAQLTPKEEKSDGGSHSTGSVEGAA